MSRLRDIGIEIGSLPTGPWNAITDVAGVRVGHCTLLEGEGDLKVGEGPVRTGVTMVFPHEGMPFEEPVFAGAHRLNGNGEVTGLQYLRETGLLTSPIGLTNTFSVGVVRDAMSGYENYIRRDTNPRWSLPVVGETSDIVLNDMQGTHITREHAFAAADSASSGPVEEGNVGGGTGMTAHGFKAGIGTSSRVLPEEAGGWTVGVLVQANYGRRERLRVNGIPVGERIPIDEIPTPGWEWLEKLGGGSIIVVVATDAPLLPMQCDRLAQRAALGVARVGGVGEHFSGDFVISFATGNRGLHAEVLVDPHRTMTTPIHYFNDHFITPMFDAVVDATEEAILNSMLAAKTMVGHSGNIAYALEADRLQQAISAVGK